MSGTDTDDSTGRRQTDDAAGDVTAAVQFVLRSTEKRPQTEAEVADKLRRRGYGEQVVDAALAEARRVGAVDDAAFATAWVEDRGRNRGFGQARLRTELQRRGVEDAQIDAAVRQLDDRDDHSTAVTLARRRARQLPDHLDQAALLRRLGGYLTRRGYPPGLAERAAREVAGVEDAWD